MICTKGKECQKKKKTTKNLYNWVNKLVWGQDKEAIDWWNACAFANKHTTHEWSLEGSLNAVSTFSPLYNMGELFTTKCAQGNLLETLTISQAMLLFVNTVGQFFFKQGSWLDGMALLWHPWRRVQKHVPEAAAELVGCWRQCSWRHSW